MTTLCLGLPTNSRLQLLRRRGCSVVADWINEPNANSTSRQYPDESAKQGFYRTMSSGASRAATAAISRDVKRNLAKLLFRHKYRSMDPTSLERYSYKDLRREYLKRVQVIHPDKTNAHSIDINRRQFESRNNPEHFDPLRSKEELKKEFQELQSTWDRYEELSKSMMKVVHGDGATSNFTQFGVGCSFSDSEEERALRTEITDQACRGWFTSGLVSSGISTENDGQCNNRDQNSSNQKSLIDDSMFVQIELGDEYKKSSALSRETKANNVRRQQRTLIPGIN